MVSLVRVVCRDGRAIEQTTRPVQTDARPNKMGFCGWWCMHMKSHVHRVVVCGDELLNQVESVSFFWSILCCGTKAYDIPQL